MLISMCYNHKYIQKHSMVYCIRICISYMRPRFRTLPLLKFIFFVMLFSLMSTYFVFFNTKYELCDPAKPLWWFCPWPDIHATVCTWSEHFPITNEHIR